MDREVGKMDERPRSFQGRSFRGFIRMCEKCCAMNSDPLACSHIVRHIKTQTVN